jgi:hypothetical protein
MRLKAARLWRLIGRDAQSCRVQLGQVGCRLGADSVPKWCCRVIAMRRRIRLRWKATDFNDSFGRGAVGE